MTNKVICPFSKPIIGGWCNCEHANLAERCSGKMSCKKSSQYLSRCNQLVDSLRENSRFVLGLTDDASVLTHAQLMKIRCGGLQGMHRLFESTTAVPEIPEILQLIEHQYGQLSAFPFSEIMPDIKAFSHRSRRDK